MYSYIDFHVEEVIIDFFSNPDFIAAWLRRLTGAAARAPGTFGFASECKRLCSVLGHDILDPALGYGRWVLHLDWVQPYNSGQHSTGILGLSCSSLAEADRSKDFNLRTVAIFPGPKQPETIDGLLERTVRVFQAALTEGILLRDGSRHIPILDGLSADTPASNKVSKSTGHTSYRLCIACRFAGCMYTQPANPASRASNSDHIYYMGYLNKALQGRKPARCLQQP